MTTLEKMVILEVYSKCIKTKYKTTLFSQATVFAVISTLVAITLPFVIAYKTKALWLKRDTFHEQPNIRFTGEYLLFALTNNSSLPIFCNNLIETKYSSAFDTCSVVKVKENDMNNDGKMDSLNFKLNVLLPVDTHILMFTLIILIDYKLTGLCPAQMQTAIILQESMNFQTSEMYFNGNLLLTQAEPLFCYANEIDNRYNYSVITDRSDLKLFDTKHILSTYMSRKSIGTKNDLLHSINDPIPVTTHLSTIYRSPLIGQSDEVRIDLTVNYPENEVYYRPGFWAVIKWAWIQYLAIYIPLSWMIYRIQKYVYENRLFLLYEASPLKKIT